MLYFRDIAGFSGTPGGIGDFIVFYPSISPLRPTQTPLNTRILRMATWMIVEDEPDLYEMLEEIFNMWGIETITFGDFDEALEWIELVDQGEDVGELPQLVMLDLMFSRILRGDEVGERLRRSPFLQDIAIVVMTAQREMPEVRDEVIRKVQPDDYIQKPLPRITDLQKRLDVVLEKRHQMNERKSFPPLS